MFYKPKKQGKEFLKIDFGIPYVEKICNLVSSIMLELPESELKNASDKDGDSVFKITRDLKLTVESPEQLPAHQWYEINVFKFALKQLRSSAIEKRWSGLHRIKQFIRLVENKNFNFTKKSKKDDGIYWLEQEFVFPFLFFPNYFCVYNLFQKRTLVKWIEEENVLDQVFGKKIHEKLVCEVSPIFEFLCHNEKLSKSHVSLLCDALVTFFSLSIHIFFH